MSYTALARKWRPKSFKELVGQDHVRRALMNALTTGRIHHAFLFTGTRGVGKTTIARIFSKCLNCDTGVTAEPCGVCSSCREIDAGRFVDLIEVDAASRTKVEDTRDLLDNVQYTPSRGRYKVYLIDEVHMLTTHSFNALLKTLEEPPPHVKFLLATTDPQKLPVTVLSRCLQFNLKRLPITQIAEHMKNILDAEGLPYDAPGLRLIAQAADGSMRDGLSLLDQLIAFGGGKATDEEARAMLGTVARDHVVRLADTLATLDAAAVMKEAHGLEEWAPDHGQLLDELAGLLMRVATRQVLSDFDDEIYAPEVLERLARALAPEDVQLFYQTAITGRRDLLLAPDPRTGFEMTLLRMIAFRPGERLQQASPAAPGASPGRAPPAAPPATGAGSPAPARPAPSAAPAPPAAPAPEGSWAAILEVLEVTGPAKLLARNSVLLERSPGVVRLGLDPSKQSFRNAASEQRLTQALSRHFGEPVRLQIETAAGGQETPAQAAASAAQQELESARKAFDSEPAVQGLRERFNATVLPDTVRPVK